MPSLMKMESKSGGTDDSDNLNDRKYAELFIENPNTIKLLSELEVLTNENEKGYQGVGAYIKELIDEYGYKGTTIASAVQRVNAVISVMKIPYLAMNRISEYAPSKKKVYKDKERLGQLYDQREPDCIIIYRYGNVFNPKMYATIESGLETKDGKPSIYEEPTEGARLRIDKWLNEIAANEIEIKTLEKVGFDISQLKDEIKE